MKKSTGMTLIFGAGWMIALVTIFHRISKHIEPILTNFEIGAGCGMVIATILAAVLLNREKKAMRQKRDAYTEACITITSSKATIRDLRDAGYRLDENLFDAILEKAATLIEWAEKDPDLRRSLDTNSAAVEVIRAIDNNLAKMVNARIINDQLFPVIDDRVARMDTSLKKGLKDLFRLRAEDRHSWTDVAKEFTEIPGIKKSIIALRQEAWEPNTMVHQRFEEAAEKLKTAQELLARFERIVTKPADILARIETVKKHVPMMFGIIETIQEQLRVRDDVYQGVQRSVEEARNTIGSATNPNWLAGYATLSIALHQLMKLAQEEGLVDEIEILDLDGER